MDGVYVDMEPSLICVQYSPALPPRSLEYNMASTKGHPLRV